MWRRQARRAFCCDRSLSIFFDRDLSQQKALRAWRRHMQSTVQALVAA